MLLEDRGIRGGRVAGRVLGSARSVRGRWTAGGHRNGRSFADRVIAIEQVLLPVYRVECVERGEGEDVSSFRLIQFSVDMVMANRFEGEDG